MKYAKNTAAGWTVAEIYGSGAAAAAQAAIFAARGYKPVADAARPADTPYKVWSADYEDKGDYVAQSWWPAARVIPLDRAKLLAAMEAAGALDAAVAYFGNDPDAQDWWANSMNYVEGSPMAEAAMAALGLSLDEVHALVESCRA